MPDSAAPPPAVVLPFPKPIVPDLHAALDRAISGVVAGRGQLAVTASLRGVEASLAYKPKSWLSVGGYAARLWGGGFEAGAKAIVTFGGGR